MGFSYLKIYGLSLLFAASGLFGLLQSQARASNEDAGVSADFKEFILPEYRKDGNRLQCILYGSGGKNEGAFITLEDPLLDIVRDDIKNIDDVSDLRKVKLYPIDSKASFIKDFWKDKTHSRGLISSNLAVYDRTSRMLRGDGVVLFRSPGMDIDGLGFDANQETKFIHIRSKVKVLIRPEMRKSVEADKNASKKAEETTSEKDSTK